MAPESENHLRLEIGHVLFIDIVGYSKLVIDEQRERLARLTAIVLATAQVREAPNEQLVSLPTGDGMALVFRTSSEAPARCAIEIAQALKDYPEIAVRMGVHSGPVSELTDLNDRINIAGAGINMAQRVMDCGDAGHILLSQRVADDLAQYRQWLPNLHDLGECEIKHGQMLRIVNLYGDEFGNAALPVKLRSQRADKRKESQRARFRWVSITGVVLLLLVAAAGWHRRYDIFRSRPNENRIAVLPFKPLVAAASDPALELGMADSLIMKLSNSRQLIVPSLTSVRQYTGLDVDPVAAGRNLGVNSVLEGNVQRDGKRLRVTARLIRVADGSSIWAGSFDEDFTDVFSVQETISRKVADALELELTREEKERLGQTYTHNVEAYQLYLTGRYHWNKLTPPEIKKSIEFFQQAIAVDPKYSLAYFGLAESYRALSVTGDGRPSETIPPSEAAARRAIELDDGRAEAHASLAFDYIWYNWNWAGAEREAQRAIALNPNSAVAHLAYAHVLSDVARHEQALAEAKRARELDPTSLIINSLEGAFLYHARYYDEAEVRLRKALELDPQFWIAHLFLGGVQLQRKNFAAAATEYEKARNLSFGNSQTIAMLGYTAALAGDSSTTRSLLDQLTNKRATSYVPAANIAHLHFALGEKDEAFAWLQKGLEEHDVFLSFLKVDPKWDGLRGDPRFSALLKQIGLD